ncbi:YpdA family putative bacillithiol disulfide reductase [Evansella cellulosilytica]|uniref:FAD-dependent pyridine nucleotide-disulfide oxidoreductase n=1 Tax=Evansella cellulosilytica (strain ATCC 21833 / DSM 2522 / FERM P-1141 / JCM 9156 / N-4) TaxID=649639 RepID=E6TYQ4_EVAC2|nr:YpdA family putative bacillithiol disulfide reductase [Evansella cellulosilytica]ADU30104.1 FAD-dependent pyridine nucleotide-disulfide oxidoreductase [Evansella cellulosilytica DSM 2522]
MNMEQAIIIGAGPCGLSAAIALNNKGIDTLIIEKGNIVNALYHYPTHQQFFSTSEKLSIGDIPFYSTERKPKRNEALVYYRQVVKEKRLRIHSFEKVIHVEKDDPSTFHVTSVDINGTEKKYATRYLIIATGYYDSPNYMGVKGETKPHVYHYFKEAHPFFDQDVAVIGGKNSAVDAALELEKAGARVSVYYRGSDYSTSVKPWILPEFTSLIKHEKIDMFFNTTIHEIKENTIIINQNNTLSERPANFVFAMTGYHPDHSFLKKMGVKVEGSTGRPMFNNETMETNVENIYVAGVIAAGNNANEIFIENGRLHGDQIANDIANKVNSNNV